VGSSQNILIPHRAYCKSGKLDGLFLHFFFSLKNIPYGVNKKKKKKKPTWEEREHLNPKSEKWDGPSTYSWVKDTSLSSSVIAFNRLWAGMSFAPL
jgi:hypothetical protein